MLGTTSTRFQELFSMPCHHRPVLFGEGQDPLRIVAPHLGEHDRPWVIGYVHASMRPHVLGHHLETCVV